VLDEPGIVPFDLRSSVGSSATRTDRTSRISPGDVIDAPPPGA